MKATGIVRRVDELGRVVIPKEMRKSFGMNEGEPIEFYVRDQDIILRKYQPGCVISGTLEDLVEFQGKQYSKEIIRRMARKAGI
ncbi:AbrB/MazE/SpoVT family DNA-binding domain-containing protein [Paenibacillus yanchengensis]|uniref:AbrB/MazE/SpoVT family DNA-binding domain-containing protein n=1 Tax=Paenibacillus yanchengensis TaxID=2035833 RepID=A0ABW4YLM1_9BACL